MVVLVSRVMVHSVPCRRWLEYSCLVPARCPAHLSVIIPIEVTHKNVAPVAANFAPPAAAAAHILAAAFLGLQLHLDPGRGLARRGELAKPATRTHSDVRGVERLFE